MNRRHLLSVVSAAAAMPVLESYGQTSQAGLSPEWASKFSPVIGKAFSDAARDLFLRVQRQQPVASAARKFATLAGVLFAHLDEIGLTKDLDRKLHASPVRPLTQNDVAAIYSSLEGVSPSDGEVEAVYKMARAGEREGVRQLANHSVRELNAMVVSMLNDAAARLEVISENHQSVPVWRVQSNSCWYWSWVLWYSTIAALALTDPAAAALAWASAGGATLIQWLC